MKAKRLQKSPNNTVRIRVLASVDRAAGELSESSGLNKANIIALAAAEGLPLLAQKLQAFKN